MESSVSNPELAVAIEAISANLGSLERVDLAPADIADATAQIIELQRLRSMLDAVVTKSLDAVERSATYRSFGHRSAKAMARHVAKLSGSEASGLEQARKMLAAMPKVAEAYQKGEIGTCQVRRLARVWANPRVREQLESSQAHVLIRAQTRSFEAFHRYLADWEHRADEDGWIDQTQRDHHNRNFNIIENYDSSHSFTGGMGNLQGAQCKEVFDHYVKAEYLADVEKARANQLDPGDPLVMPRTPQQRRADAFWQMCQDAVRTQPGGKDPRWVRAIVIDDVTFQRELARMAGEVVPADDPNRDDFRCHTIDGAPLNPTEAMATSSGQAFRRCVIDAKSVTIDLGEQRLFTGAARHAVMLHRSSCIWPGCHVPVSDTQIDHLTPHRHGGRTCPNNGAPLCGRHNRVKETGFTVWRDERGDYQIRDRHGTKVE